MCMNPYPCLRQAFLGLQKQGNSWQSYLFWNLLINQLITMLNCLNYMWDCVSLKFRAQGSQKGVWCCIPGARAIKSPLPPGALHAVTQTWSSGISVIALMYWTISHVPGVISLKEYFCTYVCLCEFFVPHPCACPWRPEYMIFSGTWIKILCEMLDIQS